MNLKTIVEAILFKSVKPLSAIELTQVIKRSIKTLTEDGKEVDEILAKVKEQDIVQALDELRDMLESHSIMLQEAGGGFRMVSRPEYTDYLAPLLGPVKPPRLSQPALETLAVIAYRQPISRAEIEAVRGVAVGGVLETLVDRGIIHVAGRADVPGRPLIYETTNLFLQHFGLNTLDDLPNVEELKRVQLPEKHQPTPEEQPELIDNHVAANQKEN
ncbi:MAG: SMC-Scp complex subunit ScpB [Verrucomicrobiota bacterium]